MPEKGWAKLTVREQTAKVVKERAQAGMLTVDEYIQSLMEGRDSQRKDGWATCKFCAVKLKASNLPEHLNRVHPAKRG